MISLITSVNSTATRLLQECRRLTVQVNDLIPFVEVQINANVIPTPEFIAATMAEYKSPEDIQELVNTFNRLKNQCNNFKNLIKQNIDLIDLVLETLNRIFSIFNTILNTLEFFANLLPILRGLIATGQAVLSAQVGLVASGTVIVNIGDLLKKLKGRIKAFEQINKILNKSIRFFENAANEIRQELNPIRTKLIEIQLAVEAICVIIDDRFLQKLSELTDIEPVDQNNQIQGQVPTFNDLEDAIAEALGGLEAPNKPKLIRFFRDDIGFFRGYQIEP